MKNVRSAVGLVLIGLFLGFAIPKLASADHGMQAQPVHVVSEGETLWDLAQQANPDGDPRALVWEIRQLNDLDQAEIFPGQKLVLPFP